MTHESLVPTSAADYKDFVDTSFATAKTQFEFLLSPECTDPLSAYDEMMRTVEMISAPASLFSNVHPDAEIRSVAETAEQRANEFFTEVSLSKNLYQIFSAIDPSGLDELFARMHTKILQDFKRSGVELDDEKRAEVTRLRGELTKISQDFEKNIREDVRSITVDSAAELAGLPEDFIAAHAPDEHGKITITTDYPDVRPFLLYAENAAARRELYIAFNTRGYPINEPVLTELLQKRFELAQLLGYPTWAAYVAEDKMIKTAGAIESFIDSVYGSVAAAADAEYKILLAKKQEVDSNAVKIEEWEKGYWEERVKKESHAFDSQSVRPYFEYNRVKKGLLDLSSDLFGITFVRVEHDVWHESVEVYDVFEGSNLRGRIYLDMHSRENKYKHAAQFTLRSGKRDVQIPEGVLVCNFTDPAVQTPALLDHDQVTTFFHEFGHLMHHVLGGNQPLVYFSGVATEWDFVEAPSQLFEEWAWDPAVLARFAHHTETGEVIPAELVNRMHAAHEFGKALGARRQLVFAATSLKLYNENPQKFTLHQRVREIQKMYGQFEAMTENHYECSFGHLDGYSAIYYTYMWSLVIAKDLMTRFNVEGLLNTTTAREYRTAILDAGGSRDAAALIETFLGRPYSFDAFNQWLTKNV